jgi:23S rRNA-intervening sequence protein
MRNYKDLVVWEKAHKLTLAIYKETNAFPKDERFGFNKPGASRIFVDSS